MSTSMATQYLLYLSYLFLSGKCLQILEAAAASDLDLPQTWTSPYSVAQTPVRETRGASRRADGGGKPRKSSEITAEKNMIYPEIGDVIGITAPGK